MSFLSRILLSSLLLSFIAPLWAFELVDANIPVTLRESYAMRQLEPLTCINTVNQYMAKKKEQRHSSVPKLGAENTPKTPLNNAINNAPTLLLAFCYIELDDYSKSLNLLMPLLKSPSITSDEIRTLNLIAAEIPESERPQLNNKTLLNMLTKALAQIEDKDNFDSPNLSNIINLTITKLALETHQYQLANKSLNKIRRNIKGTKNNELVAWLAYFYGHYYNQINQQQLAISNFRTANYIANQQQLTKLSSLTKESLSSLYQQKHRYVQALDFAGQRVELLLTTENYVQQADSLIKFAILKRQNKEYNQSLVYLFNALELVENKQQMLVAQIYLELGRTYAVTPYALKQNAQLAQKYLQNARLHFKNLNKLKPQIESILLLAKLNIRNEDTSLAILQLENVITLAKNKFPQLRVKAFELLALSYELSGDHKQANFHFKNFHALQNTIKEKIFTLQQLKINEQFQLIEQTQQQIQLETKNNQLLLKNDRFKKIAYTTILLLLCSILVIFYILACNKKLSDSERFARQQMQLHPRSKLPLHQVPIMFYEQHQGNPLFYALVHIPFLSNLNESTGLFSAEQIELKLGQALQVFFAQHSQVTQIRDNQLLFISEQHLHGNAQQFAQNIEIFFQSFAESYSLNGQISTGIVAFPFLNNVSRAIAPERMLNLTSLALFGACQLREKERESSWLELYAIEKIQPAFFDGDLWLLGQAGIDKGIVKIKSSHPNVPIDWPELTR